MPSATIPIMPSATIPIMPYGSAHERRQEFCDWLNDPSWGWCASATLNVMRPTYATKSTSLHTRNSYELMRDRLRKFAGRLNRNTLGSQYHKNPGAQWVFFATLEGNPDVSHGEATHHWHLIIAPGRDLSPEKREAHLRLRPSLTKTGWLVTPPLEANIRETWTEIEADGVADFQMLRRDADRAKWIDYITKEFWKSERYESFVFSKDFQPC